MCLKNKCHETELRINEEKTFNFRTSNERKFEIIAETNDLIKRNYVNVEIIEVPDLFVTGITPSFLKYKESAKLRFNLNSNFKAYNASLLVNDRHYYELKEINGGNEVSLNVKGKDLVYGLDIKATYYDKAGNKYTKKFNFDFRVEELPWYIRLVKFVTFSNS